MMRTELLFPTPIWIEDECGLDTKVIQDFASEVEGFDPEGVRATNAGGGWQSREFKYPQVENTPLAALYKKIILNAYAAADDFGFTNYTLQLSNLWMNVNRKGNFNMLHTHAGCILSGVYYAKVPPGSSDIKFRHPAWSLYIPHQEQTAYNSDACNFKLYERVMIIFPSTLLHCVPCGENTEPRISFSFNYG